MKKKLLSMVLTGVILFNVACSTGVLQEDYDKIVAEKGQLATQLAEKTAENEQLKAQINNKSDPTQVVMQSESTPTPENSPSATEVPEKPKAGEFNSEEIEKQLKVTTHEYNKKYYSDHYICMVVRNESDFTLSLDVELLFYDAENNLIGVSNNDLVALAPDCDMVLFFSNEDDYDRFEYSFKIKEEVSYRSAIPLISHEINETKSKLILSVTNNDSAPVEFVKYTILFFQNKKIIDTKGGYITDDDNQIKPGDTIHGDVSVPKSYDSYEIYFSGRQ